MSKNSLALIIALILIFATFLGVFWYYDEEIATLLRTTHGAILFIGSFLVFGLSSISSTLTEIRRALDRIADSLRKAERK